MLFLTLSYRPAFSQKTISKTICVTNLYSKCYSDSFHKGERWVEKKNNQHPSSRLYNRFYSPCEVGELSLTAFCYSGFEEELLRQFKSEVNTSIRTKQRDLNAAIGQSFQYFTVESINGRHVIILWLLPLSSCLIELA